MKFPALAVALALRLIAPAAAEEDDAARATRWQELRHAVFGDREVSDGSALITLAAPDRALDAALVPVGITIAKPDAVKTLWLLIDDNPSPLAGTFHFGPAADAHLLKLRVRVDAYTLIHAVTETADGRLFGVARFVKASGGCSAPATGDQQLALARLGRMKLKPVAEPDAAPGATELQLLISHPNFNGMQMDQATRLYTPARYIQTIAVSTGGRSVFDLDADISLSEDPAITFGLHPAPGEPILVEMGDSSKAVFRQSFELPAKGS
jgi:sulfur-oxidizing protein SoxY